MITGTEPPPRGDVQPERRVSSPLSTLVAWIAGLALLALHLDFWRPQRTVLYLGWLPEELLYRLVWLVLAWLFLMFFCSRIWTEEG